MYGVGRSCSCQGMTDPLGMPSVCFGRQCVTPGAKGLCVSE